MSIFLAILSVFVIVCSLFSYMRINGKTMSALLCTAAFLGFLSVAGAWGLNLEDLVGKEQIAVLATGEKPTLVQFSKSLPQLAPRHEVLGAFIESERRKLDPSVLAEILYLYEKPETDERTAWSDGEKAGLYNEVLALSTLAGLQYFSAGKDAMRTFFEASQVIDGPSSKRPLPDPVYPRPPAELTVYGRQKDTTFGDNIYQYDFYSLPDALILIQQNLTTLTAGIIPVVGKNNLRSVVAVLDAGDYLLVYAVTMAKLPVLPGMRGWIGNAFSIRAEAIQRWFTSRADRAFRKAGGQ